MILLTLCLVLSAQCRPSAIQGGPVQLVSFPRGPFPGWLPVQLTPPLYNYGYTTLAAAVSPYQRLPKFYNSYLFSPLNYRLPAQNPYLVYDENVAKTSHKEFTVEKLDVKELDTSKNVNKNSDTVAASSQTIEKFATQKINNINNDKDKDINNKINTSITKNMDERLVKDEEFELDNLSKLVALAKYNENLKSVENSNTNEKLKLGKVSSSKLINIKPNKSSKIVANQNNNKQILYENKIVENNNSVKDQVEDFGAESELDINTYEKKIKNMKLIENTVERSKTNSRNNESLILNNIRLQKIQPPERLEDPNAAFFAPYKNHPLFNYLKNKHNIDCSKLIQFKGDSTNANEKDTVTLILKPMARSIAGLEGRAISMPLSRAVVEKGTNADILFEPDAVAIVGPGGIAHAQSELEIGYIV